MASRQAMKARIRKRDGYKCVRCGTTNQEHVALHGRQLDVHRIIPDGIYAPSNCETLCMSCHGKEYKHPPKEIARMCDEAGYDTCSQHVKFPKDLCDPRVLFWARLAVGAKSIQQYVNMRLRPIIEEDCRKTCLDSGIPFPVKK